MGWECQESVQVCKESGWRCGDAGNKCGNAGNQGGNLGIAIEMTQNCSENDKLKECREVKIIENGHICKNQFHTVVNFGHI